MNGNITLRGLVLSKYKSIGEFAEALKWKRNKASRIINNIQEPSPSDITEIVKKLEISSLEMFMDIFFSSLSTLWTKRNV